MCTRKTYENLHKLQWSANVYSTPLWKKKRCSEIKPETKWSHTFVENDIKKNKDFEIPNVKKKQQWRSRRKKTQVSISFFFIHIILYCIHSQHGTLTLVSIKIPEWMQTALNDCFATCEAQFALRKITSTKTKFYHLLSCLPLDTISNLQTSILVSKEYYLLKDTVIQMHERTKPEMFAKLISNAKMTRLSDYLQELLSTACKVGTGEELVWHYFIQALTPNISPVMIAARSLSVTKLGTLSDKIIPFVKTDFVQNTSSVTPHKCELFPPWPILHILFTQILLRKPKSPTL